MILNLYRNSLRGKLLIAFIFVAMLPFVLFLSYTLLMSEKKIVNQTLNEQFNRANHVSNMINNHIIALEKNINFIASLDLMDDILADDIDKRISILLSRNSTDYSLDLSLFVINDKNKIIASSQKDLLDKEFNLQESKNIKEFVKKENLYITTKIYASFDKTKLIGVLILRYNLHNLESYLMQQEGIHSYITDKANSIRFGDVMNLKFVLDTNERSMIIDEHLIVYEQLANILQGYYLVYAVDKALALKFLNDFVRFMLYISVIIFLLIIFISLRVSKSIVKPIEELTNATKKITQEQDYSTQLTVTSQDEISLLTSSFNEMLVTTSNALESLEEENKLRLKRFIQLIEVFNTIIQTQTEDECIDVSLKEIQKITQRNDLQFSSKPSENSFDLYVTDFEEDTKVYFGSISLSLESISDANEKSFYNSIASMITLQLDRIRLISRTMAASQAKSAFISNMSHELRTPLNAIIGFSQFLITYEVLTDDQQDTVGSIESSAQYLLEMINEILDIAKIEAGKMEAHIEEVNVASVVKNAYNMLQPLASDKELAFELEYKNLSQIETKTDPKMLQQIVINLLSNAIKFTQEGFVDISLYNDEKSIFIEVKDSGIGIDSKNLANLFKDFTQVENVMQKKHKGTGLGLSLSKKMANILSGDVTLESEGLGKGSRSLLQIPIAL